jgi:hypothetical protein
MTLEALPLRPGERVERVAAGQDVQVAAAHELHEVTSGPVMFPIRGTGPSGLLRQLGIAIDWGRYGELFEYDAESGQLVLGSDPVKVGK